MSEVRLCFGIIMKILLKYKSLKSFQKNFCPAIFRALGDSTVTDFDEGRISSIVNGEKPVPGSVISAAKDAKLEDVSHRISTSCMRYIDPNRHKEIIWLILWVLDQDTTIKDSTLIGTHQKVEWKNLHTFEIEEFLAMFLLYAVNNIDNEFGRRGIKLISDKGFPSIKQKDLKRIKVFNYCLAPGEDTELPLSLYDKSFEETFHRVDFTPTGLFAANNDLQIFCLDITNGLITYDALISFLVDNLGSYVFSRKELQTYKPQHIFRNAMKKIKERHTEENLKEDLSGMLVYSFLEGERKAPKLFSLAEIENSKEERLNDVYGMHLMRTRNDGRLKIKLVINVSCIKNNLEECAATIVDSIEAICHKSISPSWLLNSNFLNSQYSDEEIAAIKSIIIPRRGTRDVDLAFGVFIGFSIGASFDIYREDFREQIYCRIRHMVHSVLSILSERLSSSDLLRYPIYLYLLPFQQAEKDSITIMHGVLE